MLTKSEVDIAVMKALSSVDEVVDSSNHRVLPLKEYADTIGVHNIEKGGVTGRVVRKSLLPFEKVFKKLFQGYLAQRTQVDTYVRDSLHVQQQEIATMRNDSLQQKVLRELMDEKIFETHKLIAGFKREILAELVDIKGGPIEKQDKPPTRIINKERASKIKKINVGSGVDTREDYVNVDHRAIEGVDVVADVLDMPFKEGSLKEILAAHLAEHFIERDFVKVIQYWFSLLDKGGCIRLIVPNIEAMSRGYAAGTITWDQLRAVSLGGQDYASDYHFNHFSVDSMRDFVSRALPEAMFEVVASERRNGECLEMEVLIKRK